MTESIQIPHVQGIIVKHQVLHPLIDFHRILPIIAGFT